MKSKNKSKKHPLIRMLCFLVLAGGIIGLLGPVFTPANTLGGIENEAKYSMDYLCFGDSECYAGISPMEIWKTYGYAGYNCGISALRMQDAYYQMQKVLEIQSPKVVLLEANLIFRTDGFTKDLQKTFDHIAANCTALYKYHNRWKQAFPGANADDKKAANAALMGMNYTPGVNAYLGGDYVKASGKYKDLRMMQKYYLDKVVALCESKQIQLVLLSVPSPICWTMELHNTVSAYAQQHGLQYVDMNLAVQEIGMDWSTDTYDKGDHVNFSGAQKISAYLGRYLSESFTLPDRREEAAYVGWNERLTAYLESTGQAQ